jgi:hypothetical protein
MFLDIWKIRIYNYIYGIIMVNDFIYIYYFYNLLIKYLIIYIFINFIII